MVDEYYGMEHEEFIKTYLNKNLVFDEEKPETPNLDFLGDYNFFKYEEEE